jgi:hypothetical protein
VQFNDKQESGESMIKFECTVSDFHALLKGEEGTDTNSELQHQLGFARGELSLVRDQKYDLEEQLRVLRTDLYQSQKSPPIANAAKICRELVANAKAENKIGCIKIIREATGLGLKEAKDLFEEAWGSPACHPFGKVSVG